MILTKNILAFLLLLFALNCSKAQTLNEIKTDTLNKFDFKGEKNGYWIEFIDKKFEVVKKKKKALFFRYAYYDHGVKLNNFESFSFRTMNLETKGNQPIKGEIVLLNGVYKLYHKDSRFTFIENYQNGIKHGIYKCFDKNGKIHEMIDYEKQYNGEEHSFYLIGDEKENGDFGFKGYYRKGKKGWRIYSLEEIEKEKRE